TLALMLMCISTATLHAQLSEVQFRFSDLIETCDPTVACFDIQLREGVANQNDGSIELADVNYRFYYPGEMMSFLSATSLIDSYSAPQIDYADVLGAESLDIFGDLFDGPQGLGFIDFFVEVDNNVNAISLNDEWVSTVQVCFTIDVPVNTTTRVINGVTVGFSDFCTQLIWALPWYGANQNLYLLSAVQSTEVQDGGGDNIASTIEDVFHMNWTTDDMSVPPLCESMYCVLDVELMEFEGKLLNENQSKLNWASASETDFSHYEIERRSISEERFVKVGEQEGARFSNERLEYSFLDDLPSFGNLFYYRLKMLDLDGSFEYSDIILIEREGKARINLFPNPAIRNKVTLAFDSESAYENIAYEIVQYNGQVLTQKSIQSDVQIGSNLIDIPLEDYADGYYFLRLVFDENAEVLSFQKM
ncbi:MAG: T9SS type A sorting domain-containing protein, partial [Bacteroidota bacterium]